MRYSIPLLTALVLVACQRSDDFGEGVIHEIITGTYESQGGVRQEVYRRGLWPIKVQAFYNDGSVLGQTFYIPIDSLMLISTRTYYPSGALKSINLRQSKIDTFSTTSIEGRVTYSVRFLRDYYIHILELYPNGKLKMRYGPNNFDTALRVERWYATGIRQSEEIYGAGFTEPAKIIEWDSLGHRIPDQRVPQANASKKRAP